MRKCFVLFEVIFLLRLDSLASKFVFVTKFACTSLALKTSPVNLLNSVVVIYLFSISLILVSQSLFLTRLLTSGILFSIVFSAAFVARLLILGILFSIVVNAAFVARLLVSGIFFSNSSLSASQSLFKINLPVPVSILFTLM